MREKQRFIDRIWKRIFRDKDSCTCDDCKEIVENGLEIYNKMHAISIYDIQCDFAHDWVYLNYRDVK